MKIVTGTVETGRHGGNEVASMLAAVKLTKLDARDLRDRIAFIGRLERSRQQRLLRDRLGSFAGIDARRAEEQQFFDTDAVRCMDNVRFNKQVVVKEVGREGVIGVQPPTRPAVRKMTCGRCDAIQSSASDWRLKSTPARPGSRSRVQDSR